MKEACILNNRPIATKPSNSTILKKSVGLTLEQYLKEIRLELAREMLMQGIYPTRTEVAYAAGFGTPCYFFKEYEKRFGKKVGLIFT